MHQAGLDLTALVALRQSAFMEKPKIVATVPSVQLSKAAIICSTWNFLGSPLSRARK